MFFKEKCVGIEQMIKENNRAFGLMFTLQKRGKIVVQLCVRVSK